MNHSPAPTDIHLVIVDVQHDFAHPAGALFVPGAEQAVETLHNCYTTHASHNSPSHSTGTPTTILHSQTRAALGRATAFNTPKAHRSTKAYGWKTSTASPLISYAKDSNKPAKNTVPLQLPPMSNANGCSKDGSWSVASPAIIACSKRSKTFAASVRTSKSSRPVWPPSTAAQHLTPIFLTTAFRSSLIDHFPTPSPYVYFTIQ